MRLHRLTVQAFGPFADRQEVDLDALAASGLFLLHGPTGAGKTSVLDAVCFALYGRVPGARAAGQPRLRSDHAADGLAPEVVCDLSVAGRRFEVTRSPAWERPKKRGSGTTTEPGRTLLREHVDGSWVPRSSRNDEASQLLTDVLGMGLEQFTKVVLLPQGEFAAFLRADAEARRPLLQRLFGTDRFDAVERWLADERRRLGRLVEDADSRLGRLLAQADQAVAGVLPGTGRPDPDVGPVEHVAFLRREVDAAVAGCRRELRHARSASVQATAARDRARARLESIRRLVECLRERDELAAEGEQAERTQAWLRDARRAAAVRGHLVALDQAVADQQSAASARAEADAVAGLDPAGDDADALAQLRDLRTELARLADAAQDEVALAAATASAAAAGVEVTRLETALASRAEQDAARARERDDVRQQAESLAAPAAAVEAAASALHEAEERLRAARTAARVEEDVSAAAARAAEAVDVAQRAREAWLDLRERRLAGMAAELAEGLVPGESCPVCGALDHPAPAAAGGDGVSAEAEGRARRTWEDAETARQAADRRLAELREQLAQATGRSGGLTVGQAAARVSAARQTLESAQEADEHRTAALSRLAALETELADGRARREELTAELARARASAEESARRVAELDGRLAALRGEDDSLASRSARLRARVEALQAALDARAAHRREGAAAERAAEAAAAAARDAGFPDPGAAAAALRPAEEIEAGEAFLRRHHDRRAAVEARLAEPGLLEAARRTEAGQAVAEAGLTEAELAEAELAEAEAALAAAAARLEAATGAAALAERAAASLADLAAHVAADVAACTPLREKEALVASLSRCAEGTGSDNPLRMRLSAYVLAARLEQVAAAATLRLDAMSGGRYALVHSDATQRGGARSGLGLRVVDAWTGQERDTSTLSGGESFLASLALALGLADVVQADAGGAAIETLFVDEGFGTLDEETLEEVMATLDGLRDGGRAVGLVSHVAELRQRIPHRLEVVKTRRGSWLRTAAGAA